MALRPLLCQFQAKGSNLHGLGAGNAHAFLSYLALERNVAASAQNQALNALVFLYEQVLK